MNAKEKMKEIDDSPTVDMAGYIKKLVGFDEVEIDRRNGSVFADGKKLKDSEVKKIMGWD